MLHTGSDYLVESYKDYKHRAMEKFRLRFENLLSGIESSSLKEEDKIKLKKEISEKLK